MAEGLTRALDEMARQDVDVLVLGREGNARFVSGATRLWLAGTRPFAPGCVVVRETGAVHLMSTTDFGVPDEIRHTIGSQAHLRRLCGSLEETARAMLHEAERDPSWPIAEFVNSPIQC